MSKVSKNKVDPERFGEYVNNLWSAFTLMDRKEDIRLLFKDLFTHTEYKMFTKRLEIARRLLENQLYKDIQNDLHVTTHTISSISNVLAERGEGLRKAHVKLSELDEKRRKAETERLKNLSNPFRRSARRKTAGGALFTAALKGLDNKITKTIKKRSAKNNLAE
jgi:uncharacterized protein YerC